MPAAVVDFMEELVTQPRRQHAYRRSAEAYVADSALTASEREAVVSGDVDRMRAVLAEHSGVKEECHAVLVVIIFDPDEVPSGA
ncbi:hypothetical protein [Streptomyces sp. NRRL S-118]|uniref:hypothetical protein n=1 Tax=Streptomyces sp. NRRL S-118 TaxID=1463881 RepID=UPI000B2DA770|nr:hypothetical protein [Streptomyces sp. NRRL S-118]